MLLLGAMVVEAGMTILHPRMTMAPLRERQRGVATPQPEATEQGKSNGALAFGLELSAEPQQDTWLEVETSHSSRRFSREAEEYLVVVVVELATHEAAAGLEAAAAMLEWAAQGQIALVHQLLLQVGIRVQASDPRPEGRFDDFVCWLVSRALGS